jgi:hypothetical protein
MMGAARSTRKMIIEIHGTGAKWPDRTYSARKKVSCHLIMIRLRRLASRHGANQSINGPQNPRINIINIRVCSN